MIISHKHRFIFIKTRKTAGTSIEISLSELCGPDDIITPISAKDEAKRAELGYRTSQNYLGPIATLKRNRLKKFLTGKAHPPRYYNHMPCSELVEHVSKDVWDSYFKFTVERNPFDKVVSFYYWKGGHKKYDKISDFILDGGLREIKSYGLYSINNVVAVDAIYKFEDMDSFTKDLTTRLGLEEPFELTNYRAKGGLRKVDSYKSILDDKAIELIKVIFAREIQLLGYEY